MKFYQIKNEFETYYSNLYLNKSDCENRKHEYDEILEVTLIEGIRNRLKMPPSYIIQIIIQE